jgi:hypothetical protein
MGAWVDRRSTPHNSLCYVRDTDMGARPIDVAHASQILSISVRTEGACMNVDLPPNQLLFVSTKHAAPVRKGRQSGSGRERVVHADTLSNDYLTVLPHGVTVGGGLEKLSQGRNFFFSSPAPAQSSAYAKHELEIISIPAQLSAYANHELKN